MASIKVKLFMVLITGCLFCSAYAVRTLSADSVFATGLSENDGSALSIRPEDRKDMIIAIGVVREILATVTIGERTLSMRQLFDRDIRAQQRSNILAALARSEAAFENLDRLEKNSFKKRKSEFLELHAAMDAWLAVHKELMGNLDEIDGLLHKDIRGGAEFERVLAKAYGIVFGDSATAFDNVGIALMRINELCRQENETIAGGAELLNDTQSLPQDHTELSCL